MVPGRAGSSGRAGRAGKTEDQVRKYKINCNNAKGLSLKASILFGLVV
jgi:hypothetical protein